jgi:hypothetical protein
VYTNKNTSLLIRLFQVAMKLPMNLTKTQEHTLEKIEVYFEKAFLFEDIRCRSSRKCQPVSNYPNFPNVTNGQLFEKNILLAFATGPPITLSCHEWTTLGLSMNYMHNVGKCTCRNVLHFVKLRSFST